MRTTFFRPRNRTVFICLIILAIAVLIVGNVHFLIKRGYLPNFLPDNKPVSCSFVIDVDKEISSVRTPLVIHAHNTDPAADNTDYYHVIANGSSRFSSNQTLSTTELTNTTGNLTSDSTAQSNAKSDTQTQDKQSSTPKDSGHFMTATLDLPPGTYELTYTSPMGTDGSIYQMPHAETITITSSQDQGQPQIFSASLTHVSAEEVTADQLQTIASQLNEAQDHGVTGLDTEHFNEAVAEAQECAAYKSQLDKTIADAQAQGYQVFYGTVKHFNNAVEVYKYQLTLPIGEDLKRIIRGDISYRSQDRTPYCLFVFDAPTDVLVFPGCYVGSDIPSSSRGTYHLIDIDLHYSQYHNQRCVALVSSQYERPNQRPSQHAVVCCAIEPPASSPISQCVVLPLHNPETYDRQAPCGRYHLPATRHFYDTIHITHDGHVSIWKDSASVKNQKPQHQGIIERVSPASEEQKPLYRITFTDGAPPMDCTYDKESDTFTCNGQTWTGFNRLQS